MVNMKKILFILFCTIVFGTVSAQDTVSKKNIEKAGGYSLTYQGEVAAAFGLGINDAYLSNTKTNSKEAFI